LVRIWY